MEREDERWEHQPELEEEENEEEAPSLQVRRSRTPAAQDNTTSAATQKDTTQLNINARPNGHVIHPSNSATENGVMDVDQSFLDQETDGPQKVAALTNTEVPKETQFADAHSRSDSCVYYDKDEGAILNSTSFGDEHSGRNLGDGEYDTSTGNFGVQKTFDTVVDSQIEGTKKDKYLSSLPNSSILSEEFGATYKSPATNEIEKEHIDIISEIGTDVTDIDVERVLEKQNTHDLYCPNCNSCITRRVILRKRKRGVRISGKDVKRNKPETAFNSSLSHSSGQATNIQVHNTAEIQLGDNLEPAVNDYEPDREPDIFRCLSCFSFFIPTGNGFKLFQIFRDKGEKVPVENQWEAMRSKSWISSIFASDKERTVEPGSGILSNALEATTETCLPAPHVNSPQDLSSIHGFKDLVKSGITESQENGEKISPSSTKELLIDGKEMLIAGDNSEKPIKMEDGDVANKHFEAVNGGHPNISDSSIDDVAYHQSDPFEAQTDKIPVINGESPVIGSQPNAPNISIDVVAYHQNDPFKAPTDNIPVINGEFPKDAVSRNRPDGLKLLISSHGSSPTPENSLEDQNPDMTVQNTDADVESNLSLHTKVLALTEPHISNITNISVDISRQDGLQVGAMILNKSAGKDDATSTMKNREGASLYGNSKQTINENIEDINAAEFLNSSQDPLVLSVKDFSLNQEQPATIAKDLRNVTAEINAGKDTVIKIESETIHSTALQRVQDSSVSEETGASPTLATHISATEPRGAAARQVYQIEIIKSIVYGGLFESITSLGVVSSAAGGNTTTLNILALALANLVGGLILIGHNLWDLKNQPVTEQMDRYKELLGSRDNSLLHITVVLLSFLVFGLTPPITYGFSFRKSGDKELKLLAVAATSLVCILVLAIGKEHVKRPPKSYLKTVAYYVFLGFMVSGVSYAVGKLIEGLLEKLHFHSNSPVLLTLPKMAPIAAELASY